MMNFDSADRLCDDDVVRRLSEVATRYRANSVELILLIAVVDERKLYLVAAYPSMFRYCVDELQLPEDAAYRHITAARAARRFPVLFDSLAAGRLRLTAIGLLAPHLTPENANDLVKAAEHKSKPDVEQLIAERFPRAEMLGLVEALPASSRHGQELALERVGTRRSVHSDVVPERVEATAPRSKVMPHATGRFALHLTIDQRVHDKLCRAQELLSHQIPSGDVTEVIDRALDALISKQEKAKLAATTRPQRKPRATKSARHVPAHVKRAVNERDSGQCTFVSETGRRCSSRTMLEFDHVVEVARGGEATVGNIRLRCHAHNQYTAECTFGREFMDRKREEPRHGASSPPATRAAADIADDRDVVPWLRKLGFRASEARRAAEHCERIAHAPLEERVRTTIAFLGRT